MSYLSLRTLLQAARDFIADIPPLALLNAERRSRGNLVVDIDRALAAARWTTAPNNMVKAARKHWQTSAIRIDDDAILQTDATGLWINAWVVAAPPTARIAQAHFVAALHALPVMEHEVYILHRVEDRSLSYVAERLGISMDDTEKLLLDALRGLYLAIHSQ